MNTENKSTELDNKDKKLHISDVISRLINDASTKYNKNFDEIHLSITTKNTLKIWIPECGEYYKVEEVNLNDL
jgi:hypothetical protein